MDKSNTPETETESDPKACEQKQLDSTNPDNGNIPQNDKDMDSGNDKAAIHENSQKYNIADTANKDDVDNETVEQLEQNPNINILGVATIDKQKPQQSSQLSSTISSENILSEFDETVEHLSKNSSESSSSGSSPPHSDYNDEKQGESSRNGAIPKIKADLTLKPKLITINKPVSTPRKQMHRKPRHTYAKPARMQPSRAKKQASQYLPDTDDSSIASDNNDKDGDFVPEGLAGKYI